MQSQGVRTTWHAGRQQARVWEAWPDQGLCDLASLSKRRRCFADIPLLGLDSVLLFMFLGDPVPAVAGTAMS